MNEYVTVGTRGWTLSGPLEMCADVSQSHPPEGWEIGTFVPWLPFLSVLSCPRTLMNSVLPPILDCAIGGLNIPSHQRSLPTTAQWKGPWTLS